MTIRIIYSSAPQPCFPGHPKAAVFAVIGPFDDFLDDGDLQAELEDVLRKHMLLAQKRVAPPGVTRLPRTVTRTPMPAATGSRAGIEYALSPIDGTGWAESAFDEASNSDFRFRATILCSCGQTRALGNWYECPGALTPKQCSKSREPFYAQR